MTTSLVLQVRGACMRIGERTIFRDVDLDVSAGEVTCLCGPSGTGKSLLARAILGVVQVRPGLVAGQLRLPATAHPDEDLWARRSSDVLEQRFRDLRRSYFGHAPQNAAVALNPGRTAGWQLALAVRKRATPPVDERQAILELAREVGLDEQVLRALPHELSGGQCQRVAFAAALGSQPKVVVADEPETGLDPILRRQVVLLMRERCERAGSGLLLITHHEDTVERIGTRVVRLGAS